VIHFRGHAMTAQRLSVLMAAMLALTGNVGVRSAFAAGEAGNPTPRTSDGRPDLSGLWGRLTGDGAVLPDGPRGPNPFGPTLFDGSPEAFPRWIEQFEADAQVMIRRVLNKPVYKPEHWEKIRATDWNYSRAHDVHNNCRPVMPRIGAPQKIVQLPNEVILFYETLNRFRIIPTDSRARDPIKVENPTWFGDSKGRWEGDTLVVDTVGVTSEGWLGPNGYLRTDETKITERFSRNGNTLRIEIVVEDPMLLEPWHMDPITTQLHPNQKVELWEELPCEERDKEAVLEHPDEGR
jgi:hypothetical protein